MRYRAVIFDLFGTLIENYQDPEFNRTLAGVCRLLEAPEKRFTETWTPYFEDLMKGKRHIEDCLDSVCRQLSLTPSEAAIDQAHRFMVGVVRDKLTPSAETLSFISSLNQKDYLTGLISDCSNEVPALWPESPLAGLIRQPVFSCQTGMKKPEPDIYFLAAKRLGVSPADCLYIDDNLAPLAGASAVGMTPVLIQDLRLQQYPRGSDGWQGPVISSIPELAHLLEAD